MSAGTLSFLLWKYDKFSFCIALCGLPIWRIFLERFFNGLVEMEMT